MLRLGKKPASPLGKKAIMFSDIFDATKMPTPPKAFGHQKLVSTWYMYGNDEFGDCVWASKAHSQMLWSLMGGYPRTRFTTFDVLSDYHSATGFIASDPDTDQGTDMKSAAEYHRKTGIRDSKNLRHRVHAYVNLMPGDVNQVAVGTYILGAVELGVLLTNDNMDQFDAGQPWTVTKANPIGGHCIPVVGRDADGYFLAVTWGRLQRIAPSFIAKYMDEAVGYLDLEMLNKKGLSPEAYNHKTLEAMLAKVSPGGRVIKSTGSARCCRGKYPIRHCGNAGSEIPHGEAMRRRLSQASRSALDQAGYGWAISDAKLRPFTDDVAAAVVDATEDDTS